MLDAPDADLLLLPFRTMKRVQVQFTDDEALALGSGQFAQVAPWQPLFAMPWTLGSSQISGASFATGPAPRSAGSHPGSWADLAERHDDYVEQGAR